jgi:bifunctional non-homologous end joining protein LigD
VVAERPLPAESDDEAALADDAGTMSDEGAKTGDDAVHPLPVPSEVARVRLTHPERVLFPEPGITKAELALYYAQVARFMLPYVAGRPLMLLRCPQGLLGDCFHQKHPSAGVPRSVLRPRIREKGAMLESLAVEDASGLLGLVQVGGLEIHAWGSRVDTIEMPDQLVFDLDPDEGLPFERVIEAARFLRTALTHLGLGAFVKTTGGKGLHVVVPIEPELQWDEAKAFCKALVDTLVRAEPDKYLANMSKRARTGKVFFDYLRNGRGATAVCIYSTRAKPGAPVSVPVSWDELTPELRSDQFKLRDVPRRLARLRHDPWEGFARARKPLSPAILRAVGAGT